MLLGKISYTSVFLQYYFSIGEINCRFIDIHLVNVTTTAINTNTYLFAPNFAFSRTTFNRI